MKLVVNGESLDVAGATVLAQVLARLGAKPEQVAVMVNDAIVSRAAIPETRLQEGDRIEVLTLARGG